MFAPEDCDRRQNTVNCNMDIEELCFNYGCGEVNTKSIKLEQGLERNRSLSPSSTGQSSTCILGQDQLQADDSGPCPTSSMSAAPICRQFWKAGEYNEDLTPVSKTYGGSSYLHIHPKFLHSNATSHKWAFGAIAELLDNAVDEIQNGATYVAIDKTSNPRNGSPALLIQDDGGGMDPEAMRRCLSFGFSDKKSNSAIGKYGNGFKTSSMRLGADAIVFSRNLLDKILTQSIGLLSYTFLTQSGYDRIVVPMVHYKFNFLRQSFESLQPKSDHSNSNLSVLLKWSPYSTEEELLKQFDDVGAHGTKVIIYNLWLDDDGTMELDFESDPKDIRLGWDGKIKAKDDSLKAISQNHVANRLHYSLRAYLSILYLKLPETFCIVLRGEVVLYSNIATDLKHPEFVKYKPNSGGHNEGTVLTTIGFLKEAPDVNVHGFNIYHKARLILPFFPVINVKNSRGRGVVGVLEANFLEPTHSKQDFEKTNVFQKLVTRLKDMTMEYWDYHCGLVGYQIPKKARHLLQSPGSSNFTPPPLPSRNSAAVDGCKIAPMTTTINSRAVVDGSERAPIITTVNSRAALVANSSITKLVEVAPVPCFQQGSREASGSNQKRKLTDQPEDSQSNPHMTTLANMGSNTDVEHSQKKIALLKENKRFKEQCLQHEKVVEELNLKAMRLKTEFDEAEREYAALLAECKALVSCKAENIIC